MHEVGNDNDEPRLFGRDVDDIVRDLIKVGGLDKQSRLEVEVRRHLPDIIEPLMQEDLTPEVIRKITDALHERVGLYALTPYQWVMFAESTEAGSKFLGAYVTRALSFEAAVFQACIKGHCPGGRADGSPLPLGMTVDPAYCDRLLTYSEALVVRDVLHAMIN